MKRTKKTTEPKWYLVYDGKTPKVTMNISEYSDMEYLIIEITGGQAAAWLLLKQTYSNP